MRVRVEEREETPGQVCPLCRAALAGAVWTCERCAASLHAECARELSRCSTLGCAGAPPGGARAPDRGPAPPRPPHERPGSTLATTGLLRELLTFVLLPLVLLAGVGAAVVYSWREPPRAPAPPAPPAPARGRTPPGEVRVTASFTLRGPPPRRVQVEEAWEPQLRIDDRVWSLEGLGACRFRRVLPYPGRPELELLQFEQALGERLTQSRYLGLTRDGRLVVVRSTMGLPGTRELLSSASDGVAPQGETARPPASEPARWVELLRGDDPLPVLDALGWLALTGPRSPYALSRRDDDAEEIVARARAAPEVRAAVEALRASADPWVREAADLAALLSGG